MIFVTLLLFNIMINFMLTFGNLFVMFKTDNWDLTEDYTNFLNKGI